MFIMCQGKRYLNDAEGMIDFDWRWEVLLCPACHKVTVLEHSSDSEHEFSDVDWSGKEVSHREISTVQLYPQSQRNFNNVPPSVDKSYQTAVRLMSYEPTACAVFVGRTLEFLCLDRKAKGNNLDQMLKDLAARKEIPDAILDMALNLKFFRNTGAHASNIEVSKQDASVLIDICEVILVYVYEAAFLLQQTKERIAQIKNSDK